MITKKTAAKIWECYREIECAQKLLDDNAPQLKDAFGRRRHLQLGVPSGSDSHRLFNVNPSLAESVIRSHIASKQAELVSANEQARIELASSEDVMILRPEEAPYEAGGGKIE